MVEPNPTWLRRHSGAVLVWIVALTVLAAGVAFAVAVLRARTAAHRTADM